MDENVKITNDNTSSYAEVPVYQEVEQKPKIVRTDSYFDGKLLDLIGWRILAFLITVITLGFGSPWAQCMLYNYQFKHTVYNGKRLKFDGTGGDLFVNIFKWVLLSIITFGIYILVIPVRKTRWVISNLHYEDEDFKIGESFFDGKTIQLIGINILCFILKLISFGLLSAFTECIKLRWINKHTVINRKKLVFTGKGLSLSGKTSDIIVSGSGNGGSGSGNGGSGNGSTVGGFAPTGNMLPVYSVVALIALVAVSVCLVRKINAK